MEKLSISFDLYTYESLVKLPLEDQSLLQKAIKSRNKAYAPYSSFKVGAAVLLENGEVVLGNNQENASYPSGLCAERVAVFQAGACFPGIAIKAIAISAASELYILNKPAAPCGNCRQSIAEYEHKQKSPIRILMMGSTGPVYKINSLADILPLGFESSYLK
ncbi:cytidine deaminase [Eudoraea chungangensis]|uniref:cytidine deaminase n=1 Tax=Eudoraea chungangensis TaxID=1481905 RepID=UPI0023EB257E|nr:cytidine deaminase [Eudoraea chungangensis]